MSALLNNMQIRDFGGTARNPWQYQRESVSFCGSWTSKKLQWQEKHGACDFQSLHRVPNTNQRGQSWAFPRERLGSSNKERGKTKILGGERAAEIADLGFSRRLRGLLLSAVIDMPFQLAKTHGSSKTLPRGLGTSQDAPSEPYDFFPPCIFTSNPAVVHEPPQHAPLLTLIWEALM